MTLEEAFGLTIRQHRLSLGLSQEQLAFNAEIDRNYVSLVERGKNSPSLRIVYRISAALEVPVVTLLKEAELRMTE